MIQPGRRLEHARKQELQNYCDQRLDPILYFKNSFSNLSSSKTFSFFSESLPFKFLFLQVLSIFQCLNLLETMFSNFSNSWSARMTTLFQGWRFDDFDQDWSRLVSAWSGGDVELDGARLRVDSLNDRGNPTLVRVRFVLHSLVLLEALEALRRCLAIATNAGYQSMGFSNAENTRCCGTENTCFRISVPL